MNNRKIILEYLEVIYEQYQELKELVDNNSDQELDNILDSHFRKFASNIIIHFDFLEMIISGEIKNDTLPFGGKSFATNEELEEHFRYKWDLLISRCV